MIEVRLTYNDLAKLGAGKPYNELRDLGATHDIIYNEILRKKLLAAGIPITGFISVTGVSSGRLTMFEDSKTKEYVYQWEPPPKVLKVVVTNKEDDSEDL